MKNLFFALAFIFVGSVGFANSNSNSSIELNNQNLAEEMSIYDENFLILNTYLENETVESVMFGCVLRVKVTEEDGSETIYYIHVTDMNCKELIAYIDSQM